MTILYPFLSPIHPLNSERKVESHENQYFNQIVGFIKSFSEEVTFKLRPEVYLLHSQMKRRGKHSKQNK